MQSILVTGGAGAIGSNLVTFLLKKGHKVIVLDDFSSGYRENIPSTALCFQGSILDVTFLENLFKNNDISHIFHLAALFANQNSVDHPQLDLEVNGLGVLRLLEKSMQHGVKKFVYTSSSCVYGNMSVMNEDAPLTALLDTPYAITKLLGEQYCKFFSALHGLNTVCVRLFNCYGPGERPGQYRNVIPNFFLKALKKESLVITGTGLETRDFTFIDDIVDGLYRACIKETNPGSVFNLGSGKPITIKDVVDAINEITKNEAPIIFKARRNWDHVEHRVADIQKAKTYLDYIPVHTLQEGLVLTYDWIRHFV